MDLESLSTFLDAGGVLPQETDDEADKEDAEKEESEKDDDDDDDEDKVCILLYKSINLLH